MSNTNTMSRYTSDDGYDKMSKSDSLLTSNNEEMHNKQRKKLLRMKKTIKKRSFQSPKNKTH